MICALTMVITCKLEPQGPGLTTLRTTFGRVLVHS